MGNTPKFEYILKIYCGYPQYILSISCGAVRRGSRFFFWIYPLLDISFFDYNFLWIYFFHDIFFSGYIFLWIYRYSKYILIQIYSFSNFGYIFFGYIQSILHIVLSVISFVITDMKRYFIFRYFPKIGYFLQFTQFFRKFHKNPEIYPENDISDISKNGYSF